MVYELPEAPVEAGLSRTTRNGMADAFEINLMGVGLAAVTADPRLSSTKLEDAVAFDILHKSCLLANTPFFSFPFSPMP